MVQCTTQEVDEVTVDKTINHLILERKPLSRKQCLHIYATFISVNMLYNPIRLTYIVLSYKL